MENKTIRIVSAHQLSKEQCERLEKAIAEKHGESLTFEYAIDSEIIGGLKIEDGYDVFDATLKSKITSVKKQIK